MTLILAQVENNPFGETATTILEQGQASQQFISESMDLLWQEVLFGGLYGAIARLGLLIAIMTLAFWLVKWAKAMMDDATGEPFSQLIFPLIVVVLLANNGALLAQSTFQGRSILNQVNAELLESTARSFRLDEAFRQQMEQIGAENAATGLASQCASIPDAVQRQNCVDLARAQIEESSPGLLERIGEVGTFLLTGAGLGQILRTFVIQFVLVAFGIAFQWIVEISWMLTGLLGPLAVGGTLLPFGQKPIVAWLTGFFSVGMVKLSYNIIVGLTATLVQNAGPTEPMIFALAVGILAPILALMIAAGGGMAVFNGLSSGIATIAGTATGGGISYALRGVGSGRGASRSLRASRR
ncbi:hypothetical protein IQ268_16770 [Oculatella sp. LEGE 06141]|uniref:hypothetical protein n=1 Tax=Oculatella sp. LEGE 06141 TaxID=1828648 RepID=UPI0018817FE1|nr:hypothetical protein [Oculatella sp. LEGE 06141]MBE9180218.1 hypothetical protein [Oculatella sp. LEGE 06141]